MNASRLFPRLLLLCIAAWVAAACATIGTPSGGPRDEEPPRMVRSNPAPYATNVTRKTITIDFDEIVNVKDAFSKVVISPTGAQVPRVSSHGRRVEIQFQDTLEPNTTYTIDFADAIEDNNEGNKLTSMAFTFSTGDEIDTLQISGMVLDAKTLEPQQGMLVGVHTDTTWSAFSKKRLVRVAKTDDMGRFTIRGLNDRQPYRVFALKDINNDFTWDNPDEDIAFYDALVVPTSAPAETTDTVFDYLTGRVDTVITRQLTEFFPNDILLSSFNIDYKPQFLKDYTRVDSTRLTLTFAAPAPALPEVSIVGAPGIKDWAVVEHSATNDTITYWLRSKALISSDTLRLSTRYLVRDSMKNYVPQIDTLRFVTERPRAPKAQTRKKQRTKKVEAIDTVPKTPLLNPSFPFSRSLDVYAPIALEFDVPLDTLDLSHVHIEMETDSVWHPVLLHSPPLERDSLAIRRYYGRHSWTYGGHYRIVVDSLAALGINGLHNGRISQEFKVKSTDEYANLYFNIAALPDSVPAFIELLSGQDSPLYKSKVINGRAAFQNVNPGTYYARLVEDLNGNGKFDTGSLDSLRQPEATFYFPAKISLKKNWDMEQDWDLLALPVDIQKPYAIKKNRPASGRNNKQQSDLFDEEDDVFDPQANPFDVNDQRNRRQSGQRTSTSGNRRSSGGPPSNFLKVPNR